MRGVPRVSADHLTARREQILAAARICFLRNGLHSTSMQDLIREADLSVGAVYRYFKSKNEIISAIAEDVAGSMAVRLHEIAVQEPALPLVDAMSLLLDEVDAQLGPDGNFRLALQVWTEATLDPAIGPIVRERLLAVRSAFAELAKRAAERGELPPGADLDGTATVLFGMLPGYALQRTLIGDPAKETYLAGVRALFTSGR